MVEVIITVPQIQTIVSQGIQIETNLSEDLKKAASVVERVLEKHQIARNNDLWLIMLTWVAQKGAVRIEHEENEGFFIPFEAFDKLLMPESITRSRRFLNYEENKYLPTDPEVLRKRRLREEKFKEEFSKIN